MDSILGLTAALCFGLADFFARFSTRAIGIYRTLFYMQVVGFIVLSLYLLLTGQPEFVWTLANVPLPAWTWAIVAACLNTLSYLALYYAFKVGKLAIVAPIASSYAAVTLVLSIVSGESVRIRAIIGIVAVLVGVVLAAMHNEENQGGGDVQNTEMRRKRLPSGVIWALAAALGLGITFWLLGFMVTPVLGTLLPVWIFRLVGMCLLFPLALISRQKISLPRGSSMGFVLGIGLLDTSAFIASASGFAVGQVAVVSVLSSLYSAVAVLLAWVFLNEKLVWSQWLGIGVLLVGIVLIHL